jgi:hypothetical protein
MPYSWCWQTGVNCRDVLHDPNLAIDDFGVFLDTGNFQCPRGAILLTQPEVLIPLAVQEVNLTGQPEVLLGQLSNFFKGKAWSNNLEEFHGNGF